MPLTVCTPEFYCAPSESGRLCTSFSVLYVQSHGDAQGIYTTLDIVPRLKDEPYPTKVSSYAEAKTKWQDICVTRHKHSAQKTRGAGPRLDDSFSPTPSVPSSPVKKAASARNTFPPLAPFGTGASFSSSQRASPSPTRLSSPGKRRAPSATPSAATGLYFLYESAGHRLVFSSSSTALNMYDDTISAGQQCILRTVECRADVEEFMLGTSGSANVNDDESDNGLS